MASDGDRGNSQAFVKPGAQQPRQEFESTEIIIMHGSILGAFFSFTLDTT